MEFKRLDITREASEPKSPPLRRRTTIFWMSALSNGRRYSWYIVLFAKTMGQRSKGNQHGLELVSPCGGLYKEAFDATFWQALRADWTNHRYGKEKWKEILRRSLDRDARLTCSLVWRIGLLDKATDEESTLLVVGFISGCIRRQAWRNRMGWIGPGKSGNWPFSCSSYIW